MLLKISYISNCAISTPKVKTIDIRNMYSCLNAMEEFLHSEDKALDLWWNWIRLTDYPCVKRIGNVELALVEEVEMKFGYKLRVYHISGNNKGNLKEECFFQTKEQMDKKYNELFRYDLYSLNPTAWEWKEQEWCRMAGY